MRTFLTCALISLSPASAMAFDSVWQRLESYRILAGSCPAEIQRTLKGLPIADLDEPVAIIYEREAVFTTGIGRSADIIQARKALDDYRTEMVRQIGDAVKSLGCEKAIQRLGLNIPKPITKPEIVAFARSVALPTSERTDAIPAPDRIGTKAAYPLQKIITRMIVGKKQCDLTTLKATTLKETAKEAINPPPFVGISRLYEERWDLACDGNNLTTLVTFVQDARRWRTYEVEMTHRAGESAEAATNGGGLRKGLD